MHDQLPGKELSKSQQKVVDDLKGLKDIKDPKEYDEKIMLITGDIMKDEFLTTGAADVVEMVSYMRELNKGNNAYMPAASNYPLGDIISISPEKINFEKDENHLIIGTNFDAKIDNCIIIDNLPKKISKLVEIINLSFLKKQFKNQSKHKIGKYTLDLNSRKIYFENKSLNLTEKESD